MRGGVAVGGLLTLTVSTARGPERETYRSANRSACKRLSAARTPPQGKGLASEGGWRLGERKQLLSREMA